MTKFQTIALVLAALCLPGAALAQSPKQAPSLLQGKIVSHAGAPLAGIPVRAYRKGSTITVAVYSDAKGEYSFPTWSDLTPGAYSVSVVLPEFTHVTKDVSVATAKTAHLDFTLTEKPVTYEEATGSEIIAGLPGTDHQKTLFAQCTNCHTLQWALRVPRTKEGWTEIIKRMGGSRAFSRDAPGTYAFNQKRFLEPLAEYLTSIRGPGSKQVPFKPRPRPTGPESTNLVVTEYDLPRGGKFDLYLTRGNPDVVWPHDVVLSGNYAYYTDHFSFVLGQMNLKTGAVKEIPFSTPSGAGREDNSGGQDRAGNPGGGAHDLAVDKQGNVFIGMGDGTVRYNPKTGKFTGWPYGTVMFGLDPDANVWITDNAGPMVKLDTSTDKLKLAMFQIPPNDGIYDMDTDSKGRTITLGWRNENVGIFDPKTVEWKTYPTPTKMAGPRRGDIDSQDRMWFAEYFAGNIGVFDPVKGEVKEYPLNPGTKPYTAPYALPYTTTVDSKNQIVWTNDFSSSRVYRFDIKTEKMTEYLMPLNYEIRDLTADLNAPRPTFWIPNYRAPSKLVKVQMR